jgi:hypothetical protein
MTNTTMVKNVNQETDRERLKGIAKEIRWWLKKTGGVFSVRVQSNNVIWISGMYASGVPMEQRKIREDAFNEYLIHSAKRRWGVELYINSEGMGTRILNSQYQY